MIKNMQPLSLDEVEMALKGIKDSEKKERMNEFVKRFSKLDNQKANDLKKEIEGLNMMKMKQENIIKIADIVPEDAADLNKIFLELNLDEDETNKILDIVKKYV